MQINHCLILAAGFGTRMGSIGQQLPKVLWPVFEKSLLELQVGYARSLGIQNIFINLHHMGEEIEMFCKSKPVFEGVNFIWERPVILDIGGAIHNVASLPQVKYKGRLLVLNADQFFYLSKDKLFLYLESFQKYSAVLFSYWVNTSLGYNALQVDSSRLIRGIINNKELPPSKTVETYTGISIIDLSRLRPVSGRSSFFESVCPLTTSDIPAILLEKVDYWDFGTLRRYWETSFHLLQTYKVHSNHPFLRFLVQEKALKTWKIDHQNISYHAQSPKVINLDLDKEMKDLGPSIILGPSAVVKKSAKTVWMGNLSEEIN